jgi:hypothetical protein
MEEYLSLYAERNDGEETYYVKNYPERGNRITEETLLNSLGAEGWQLVAVVPAYGGGGAKINHQLYLKRTRGEVATSRLDPYGR